MEINLTQDQITLIAQRQGFVNATKLELNHAQDKLDSLIVGIATSKGVSTNFTYSIAGTKLVIQLPPEPEPLPEG